MDIQKTVTIRQRGQITIPDEIRKKISWARTNLVVNFKLTGKNEITIQPYRAVKQVDWDGLFKKLKKIRSFKGKRGNLSEFIIADRENH